MTRDEFLQQLHAAEACREGRTWVKEWDPEWTSEEMWLRCERGDFLLWLLSFSDDLNDIREVATHVVRRLVGEWTPAVGQKALAHPCTDNVVEAFCEPDAEPAAFAASMERHMMHRSVLTAAKMRTRKGRGTVRENLKLAADAIREKVPTGADAQKMITCAKFFS